MRWPDIFFKSRKPKPAPEPAPAPSPQQTEAQKKKEKDTSREAEEKADSLRALTESGSSQISRTAKDAPAAAKAIDNKAANAETTRISVASATAEASAASAALRSGAVSLRQRAKLTEDARVRPKSSDEPAKVEENSVPSDFAKKSGETSTTETKPAPAAVVPPSFPVAVETGSVLEKSTEKKDVPSKPIEAKPLESKTADANPSPVKNPPESAKPESAAPSQETTRVRLGDTTPSSPAKAIEPVKPASGSREKQEFVLANGERIFGHVLSETPQTIYLDHGTLGVLTLPRSEIAKKPIEVILINGDRIVGDLIAETPDCLYIRHASLGMLTVPHSQRSTRVVEAIMKDGDRILGEVLAETDLFTVIRSATLGTVAVQHEQVAMLNRKIEQMQLRTLPPAAATLEDKPKA